jgi:hypothetical protein
MRKKFSAYVESKPKPDVALNALLRETPALARLFRHFCPESSASAGVYPFLAAN